MSNQQPDNLTGHNYDGIEEYDNPLPGWWSWLWAASIAFSAVYFGVVMLSGGQLSAVGAYDRAMAAELRKQLGGGNLKPDAPTLYRLSMDPQAAQAGAAIFATNCVACHGRDASGLVGPNLTDDYYINVTKIEDIYDVVSKGRKNGTMPTWANRLSPGEIILVSSYVASLRGKNLPGPRGHEGQVIPPWSAN